MRMRNRKHRGGEPEFQDMLRLKKTIVKKTFRRIRIELLENELPDIETRNECEPLERVVMIHTNLALHKTLPVSPFRVRSAVLSWNRVISESDFSNWMSRTSLCESTYPNPQGVEPLACNSEYRINIFQELYQQPFGRQTNGPYLFIRVRDRYHHDDATHVSNIISLSHSLPPWRRTDTHLQQPGTAETNLMFILVNFMVDLRSSLWTP